MKKNHLKTTSITVLIGYGVSQLLRLFSNLIMTRLLVPEAFGVMAICQTFIFILTMLSDIGISPSVVKSTRGEETNFLKTAWTLQLIRGAIISCLVITFSFILSYLQNIKFFAEGTALREPILVNTLLFLALTPLITGFASIGIAVSKRKLQLFRLTIIELFGQFFGMLSMIVWAHYDPSINALLFGGILGATSYTIASHLAFKNSCNRIGFEKESFREVFSFGKWIILTSLLTAVLKEGDKIIIGSLVDLTTMGAYSIAVFISSAIMMAFLKLQSLVFFPLLSKTAREDIDSLGHIYYRIRLKADLIAFISSGFLFSFGNSLISLLYDERYVLSGYFLQILALSLLFTPSSMSNAVYLALGKSKYVSAILALESAVKLISIPLLFKLGGINYAIWGVAFYSILVLPIHWQFKRKLGILNILSEIRAYPIFSVGYILGIIANYTITCVT
ncbi:oligosaccharide flippase family protein [Alteromonas sp. BMJM2]|uniref:oligosaccharide flippase family protein n=1 Tax=Alteromonas sp. BMJM2 TaxID=2954241 RepID=UPI0022B31FA1|nr:oligosaccharide flippase family protein [Alteromonas sp. BMJM2]